MPINWQIKLLINDIKKIYYNISNLVIMFLFYFIFFINDLIINSLLQYFYYPKTKFLWPLSPYNHYSKMDRFRFVVNQSIIGASSGYALNNATFYPNISFLESSISVTSSLVILTGLVYYGHIYAHQNKYMWDKFHKYHHQTSVVRPFEGSFSSIFDIALFYVLIMGISLPIFRFTQLSFLVYLLLITVSGIFDHSGIDFKIPYLYSAEDHALHHQQYNCNYGFPLFIFDKIHGTFKKE